MYKRVLVPTDGSVLSRQTVLAAVAFARNIDAAIVGIHVIPKVHQDQLEAWMHHDPQHAERQQALFERVADEYLTFVANSALAEGVPCKHVIVKNDEPHQAIVKTAERERCDLIFMASHGWQGDTTKLLGSETLKVLQHSPVPVLVHKQRTAEE
jgi:nucleotide-binding universal stress UspA family protein